MGKKTPVIGFILLTVAVLVTVFYHNTQQADINYYRANRLFRLGEYRQSIPYYETSLEADPNKINTARELAYAYLWADNPEKSIALFKKIIKNNPEEHSLMQSLASAYSWTGDYDNAIKILNYIVEKTGSLQAKIQLSEVYIWNAEPEKALIILKDILKQSPEHTKAKILWAKSLYYTGESEEASEVLEGLLVLDDEELSSLLAEVYVASEKHEKAIISFREIVEKEPLNVKARTQLAALLSWAGRYDESIAQYKYALKSSPKDLKIMQGLAQVYAWQGKFKEAELAYKDMLNIYPDYPEVYTSLGEVLAWQNKYDEAIYYFEKAIDDTKKASMLYGKTFLYSGRYDKAKNIFMLILSKDPEDVQAKHLLADCYAYTKDYEKAIALYRQVLIQKDTPDVKESLADTLSWDKQYDLSIAVYDEILDEKYDAKIHRQKARVLGWAKRYRDSDDEYKKILEREFNENIDIEMQAKRAYYNSRNRAAMEKYSQLVYREPDNAEAIFDLAQIYSYEFMWQKAKDAYRLILDTYPDHSRAKEALCKTQLISERILLDTRYDFFKGQSTSRETDIKKHQALNSLSVPLNDNTILNLDYFYIRRNFKDFDSINENQGRIKLSYLKKPDWQAGAYYGLSDYSKGIDKTLQFFGGNFSFFIDDTSTLRLNYDRQILDDNSTVIRDYLYRDNFNLRADFNVSRRFKIGADYTIAHYSDNNMLNEPGFDLLCYLNLEPKMFYFKYRYFYKEFKHKDKAYWTPKGLSTNTFTLNWRHFLNKEEIFFGADNIFYDLRYDLSIDSERVAGHKFTCEFNWDISKKLNFNIAGSVMGSSNSVYKEEQARAGFKYYF
jgi:tetratricopeptide (TPR) repeat protein